jgi:GNAT superfamily N-acetyltransferase
MWSSVEAVEAQAWAHSLQAVASHNPSLAIQVECYGAAVALRTRAVDNPSVNRVIGLGLDGSLPDDLLDDVIADYEGAGVARFVIHTYPTTTGAVIESLATRGFSPVRPNVKLWRSAAATSDVSHNARFGVEEIGEAHASLFIETVARELGVPPAVDQMIVSGIGHPAWRHYLVFEGKRAIAGGALYVKGVGAWCGFAATQPEYRNLGAQSLLIERRILDAAAAGCEWITADTIAERGTQRNASLQNMLRLGFTVLYERGNHLRAVAASTKSA